MSRTVLLRLTLVGIVALAAAVAFVQRDALDPAAVNAAVAEAGALGPLLFVALFALGTVAFVPGALFGLAGGALFGPVLGTVFNLTGASLGAVLAFVIARTVAGDWVRRRTGPRLDRLVRGVEAEGWRFVAFVRLVPLFPFNLLNYALGLTRIGLRDYTLATVACMVPGTLAFAWLGHAGRAAAAGAEGALRQGLIALGLLAAVVFLPRLVKRLRGGTPREGLDVDALRREAEAGDLLVLDVRDADAFAAGHVPGAKGVPLPDLNERLAELEAWRDRPVATICHTDRRSTQAARMLRDHGFRDVRVVVGGMVAWTGRNHPVETGE